MSIQLIICNPNKQYDEFSRSWWVVHPMNDAILAYCDTEREADEVIEALNKLKVELKKVEDKKE